jgi:hypothetical protein
LHAALVLELPDNCQALRLTREIFLLTFAEAEKVKAVPLFATSRPGPFAIVCRIINDTRLW